MFIVTVHYWEDDGEGAAPRLESIEAKFGNEHAVRRYVEEEIHVRYADEDMGCNCGEYTMKNGEFLKSDFAPSYRDQTPEDKEKWRRFACDVRGYDG